MILWAVAHLTVVFQQNPSDAELADDRKTISGNRTDGIRDTGSCIFKKTALICKAVGGSR